MSVDQKFRSGFHHYAIFIYYYRYLAIIFPIIIAGLLTTGLVFIEKRLQTNPDYLFAPINGRHRFEKQVLSEHWPLKNDSFLPGKSFDQHHWTDVVAVARDGGNILRENYLKELADINFYILHNISVFWFDKVKQKRFKFTYQELCLRFKFSCYENGHIQFLIDHSEYLNMSGIAGIFAEDILSKEVVVTYPTGRKAGGPLALSALVGGVQVVDDQGHFDYARGIRLLFNPMDGNADVDKLSYEWKMALQNYLVGPKPPSKLLDFGLWNSETIYQGLHAISLSFLPDFMLSVVLLTVFACLCSTVLLRKGHGIDWVRSKPLLAISGVVTAGMGIGSAYGLLLFCNMAYNDIVLVMPFLVISIGVDNMFIMTAAWHRTNPKDSTKHRLAHTLADAAVPITITSTTDFLSFAVGCITVMPVVWVFCSYTAAGILFTYIYQLTFFAGILAVTGDMEKSGRHCLIFAKAADSESQAKCSTIQWLFMLGTIRNHQVENDNSGQNSNSSLVTKFFRNYYGPILLKPSSKVFILLVYIVYGVFAIWGAATIQEGLENKRLVDPNFYFTKYYDYMMETFWAQGEQVHVVVNSPPDLSESQNRTRVLSMIDEFAALDETMGPNATIFWLKEFKDQMEFYGLSLDNIPSEDFYPEIRNWLLYAAAKENWVTDIHWASDNFSSPDYYEMVAFRFQIGLKSYGVANVQKKATKKLREVAAKFDDYNVTTYHPFYPYADWYMIILPTTFRNLGIALVCMVVVAVLLIPSLPCAALIALAIISIDLGVFGYMSWFGINLDCVSMITLIMSTGFAVDLSAHISYAYVQAKGSANHRAIEALETLGWPVFQGGFSTILGMVALVGIKSYIISAFITTVFLVIFFGLAHSLAFIPVALTVLLPENLDSCVQANKSNEDSRSEVKNSEGQAGIMKTVL